MDFLLGFNRVGQFLRLFYLFNEAIKVINKALNGTNIFIILLLGKEF